MGIGSFLGKMVGAGVGETATQIADIVDRFVETKEEKKAAEIRQVIRGWDGTKTVTLKTVRDLSARLRDLTPRSCLKWTGRISHSDDAYETWSVTNVEIVACPEKLGAR